MLTVHQLSKHYGVQPILKDISFSLSSGDRIGLVGPNGCGKSTLMRILVRDEKADKGTLTHTDSDIRVGYLAQGMELNPEQTIHAALAPATASGQLLEEEVAALASALAADPANPMLQERFDQRLTLLAAPRPQPESIFGPLGLGDFHPDTPLKHLSGGQKTRLMLARILLDEPNLLLLDEPTNHLDIHMLEWLEEWLRRFNGATLLVSHDRAFLDNVVTTILELDPLTQQLKSYSGNYSDYAEQKRVERQKVEEAHADQRAEIRRVKQDITRTKEQARHVEITTTSRQPGVRAIAKKVAKKAKSREKKLNRYVNSDERVERPPDSWKMKLDFQQPIHKSTHILTTENLAIGYAGHEPLLKYLNLSIYGGQRIALTGENGTGKTTLLRTITGELAPLAGSLKLGQNIKLGYMAQEQEFLDLSLSAMESLQKVTDLNETEARRFLHQFLFSGDDPLRPCGNLSFGERARLQLALLVARGCTFLVLDEPINHLDIASRTQFEEALSSFNGSILAVIHDRYFIESFASDVWEIADGKIVFR